MTTIRRAELTVAPRRPQHADLVGPLTLKAVNAMRDVVAANGKKGTAPPLVGRNLYYVSSAIDEVCRTIRNPDQRAAVARAVTAKVTNGLLGQTVLRTPASPTHPELATVIANKWLEAASRDGADRAKEPRPASAPDQHVWTPFNEAGEPVSAVL